MAEVADRPDRWSGDVHLGVAAWTGGAGLHRAAVPERDDDHAAPPDPKADGPEADPESVARKILLDALTGQARSRHELAQKLAKKEVPPQVAARLLDRFEEIGLVNDAAFARDWVQARQRSRGLARRALAQELRRKGIGDDVARDALDEVDSASEAEAARALVRKKLRSLRDVDDLVATRRLAGMLARKGYPPGLAFGVVKEELAAARGADADAFDDVVPDSLL